MKPFISIFVIFLSWSFVNAQSCRPAELNYIVRDERGNVFSESMLHKVFRDVKPPKSGIGTVAFTDDGKLGGGLKDLSVSGLKGRSALAVRACM